jgi:hypothetical protein
MHRENGTMALEILLTVVVSDQFVLIARADVIVPELLFVFSF